MKTRNFCLALTTSLVTVGIASGEMMWMRYVGGDNTTEYFAKYLPSEGSLVSELPMIEGHNIEYSLWDDQADVLAQLGDYILAFPGEGDIRALSEDAYPGEVRVLGDNPFYVTAIVETPTLGEVTGGTTGKIIVVKNRDDTVDSDSEESRIISPDAGLTLNTAWGELRTTTLDLATLAQERRKGTETFTLYMEGTGDDSYWHIDRVTVNVFPEASASISGITAGEVISLVPELTFQFYNLYPVSESWARIYSGTYDPTNENGTFITPVSVTLPRPGNPIADEPQQVTLPLSNWGELIPTDGVYTIELLTQTPYDEDPLTPAIDPRVLTHVTFEVDRTIEVNGEVFSSE